MSSILSSLASPAWARGGAVSRQAVRDLAFLPNTFDVEFLRNAVRQRDERILVLEREVAELRALTAVPATATATATATAAAAAAATAAATAAEAATATSAEAATATEAATAVPVESNVVENTIDSRTLPTSYDVFCNCSAEELSRGQLTKDQFASFIAFNYSVHTDLTPHLGLDKEAFVAALHTFKTPEGGDLFESRATAPTIIYKALKFGAEHLGREFIVAVAGSQGGGLEIRRITGPYRFTEGVRCANGSIKYWHQFPTETVRVLTAEESLQVAEARKNKLALQWSCVL
jgi:hypothetical protein